MIKKLSIALLVLCLFCLVGCNVPDGDSFLVTHDFDNYGDYTTFYDNFCEYNQERYIMPQDTESIEFIYHFTGVASAEYCNTDYNYLDYWHVFMSLKVISIENQFETEKPKNCLIEFSVRNIADEYDYVCNHLTEISYRVNNPKDKWNQSISIIIGEIEVASTGFGSNNFEDNELNTLMDNIISAYKGGGIE